MIYSKAAHPNCMYLWMNYIISPQAQAKVAEWFGEAPVNLKACNYTTDKNFCSAMPRHRRELVEERLLLDDAHGGLRWQGRNLQDPAGLGERVDGDPRLADRPLHP